MNDIIASGVLCTETGEAPCTYVEPAEPTPTETPIESTFSPTPSSMDPMPASPTEPMPPTGGEPEGTDVHTYVGCYEAVGQDLDDDFDFAKQLADEDMTPSVSVGWENRVSTSPSCRARHGFVFH